MSSTTEVITFQDLIREFIVSIRGSESQASTVVIAKRALNTALQDVHVLPGNKFPWQYRRATLITNAPYSTGTVTITDANRLTVNGSGTAWNTAVTGFGVYNTRVGGKMTFGGVNEVYEVSAVGGDTSVTLATRYTGDAFSGQSYRYYEDEYALVSDFKEFVDIRQFSTDMNIPLIGSLDFRRRFPRNDITGRPRVASHIQIGFATTTAPRHRVIFNPAPDNRYSIPYWYVTSNLAVTAAGVEQPRMENDTDEPIVPVGFRRGIVLHALYNYFIFQKDDVRSQEIKPEYTDFMVRIAGMREIGNERPQLVTRMRSGGGNRVKYDYNGHFDKMDW